MTNIVARSARTAYQLQNENRHSLERIQSPLERIPSFAIFSRRFRYSDFGVATSVATVTLLDEQDREGNAKFGSCLSTRRVEPP